MTKWVIHGSRRLYEDRSVDLDVVYSELLDGERFEHHTNDPLFGRANSNNVAGSWRMWPMSFRAFDWSVKDREPPFATEK